MDMTKGDKTSNPAVSFSSRQKYVTLLQFAEHKSRNMKLVILCLATFVIYAKGASLRQLIGACVETCSTDPELGLTCPQGYVCRFNGCGHTCQAETGTILTGCHGVMCDLYCLYGFMTGPDGCPICQCQAPVDVVVS